MDQLSTLATGAGEKLSAITSLPTDVLVLAGAALALAYYGMQLGKYRLVAFILALYPAAVVTPLLSPYLEGVLGGDLARSVVFLGFALTAHIGLSHVICSEFSGGFAASAVESALFGALAVGVLLSLGFTVDAIDGVRIFSESIRHFVTGTYALGWVVGSVALCVFTARRF